MIYNNEVERKNYSIPEGQSSVTVTSSQTYTSTPTVKVQSIGSKTTDVVSLNGQQYAEVTITAPDTVGQQGEIIFIING